MNYAKQKLAQQFKPKQKADQTQFPSSPSNKKRHPQCFICMLSIEFQCRVIRFCIKAPGRLSVCITFLFYIKGLI